MQETVQLGVEIVRWSKFLRHLPRRLRHTQHEHGIRENIERLDGYRVFVYLQKSDCSKTGRRQATNYQIRQVERDFFDRLF
jgi:hypothetical protein